MSSAGFQPSFLASANGGAASFRPLFSEQQPADNVDIAVEEEPDDPFARGVEEGQALAALAFDIERQQIQALLASAEALQDEPSEELARLIAETVATLVTQIVETAPIDADWLSAQARKAAGLIGDCDAVRTMCLHPEDIALLDGQIMPLEMRADPDLPRGSIRIDSSAGWVEHGRAQFLVELRTALGVAEDDESDATTGRHKN
jgi:flagellar assembly protein FliH